MIIEALTEKVTQDVYEAVSHDLADLRRKQADLKENIGKMQKSLTNMQEAIEEQEQYSRRECLRFYGVPESASEDTDDVIIAFVEKHLKVHLEKSDVARSHRITPRGGRKEDNPLPIIVRFTTYNIRRRVYEAKAKLKGSKVFIQEDLTSFRRELVSKARKMPTVRRVRTSDGRITAWKSMPDGNEKKVVIRNINDIALLE